MPLFLSLAWVLSLAKAWSPDLNGRDKSGIHVMPQILEKKFSTHPHSLLAASLFYTCFLEMTKVCLDLESKMLGKWYTDTQFEFSKAVAVSTI